MFHAADFVLDREEQAAAFGIDDILKTVLMLIAWYVYVRSIGLKPSFLP